MKKLQCSYLMLGAGKVSTSLAHYLQSAHALTEDLNDTQLLSWNADTLSWDLVQSYPGKFEDLPWEDFEFDHIFLSPGVNPNRAFFSAQLRVKELRELDLFCRNFEGFIFVITGTNGKSTATYQAGHVAKKYFPENEVFVGGNLGTPMFDLFFEKPKAKIAVLEISSYQAERLKSASFQAGLLLNLAPDHLDRYASVEDYYRAKWDLMIRSKQAYFPKELKTPQDLKLHSHSELSLEQTLTEILYSIFQNFEEQIPWKTSGFKIGPQDLENLPRLPHRLEKICSQPFLVINDSKATNVNSVVYALREMSVKGKIRLILGGIAKGDDFSILLSELRPQDEIWIYGKDRELIQKQLVSAPQRTKVFPMLSEMLDTAFDSLGETDLLLLSPGCASFDEFKNYEDRGNFFRSRALAKLNCSSAP